MKRGNRVQLSESGVSLCKRTDPARRGTVVRAPRGKQHVYVLWDGLKHEAMIAKTFLKGVDMLLEEYFVSEEHGSLFGEFVEWLVIDGPPHLTKRVWALLTTGAGESLDMARLEIAGQFIASENEADLDERMERTVRALWPAFPGELPLKRELDREWPLPPIP